MPKPRSDCLIFLVNLFLGFSSGGTETVSKYVCSEDSIQVLKNIPLANGQAVNLLANGDKNAIIATWSLQSSIPRSSYRPGYMDKWSLDEQGNMWMRNVRSNDEGKYVIQYEAFNSTIQQEVQIIVMVAPSAQCRPNIMRMDSFLLASVEANDCGKPIPSVRWLDYPGHSGRVKTELKLHPGKEAGTYYACVESQALKCAKMSALSDYCTGITIIGNDSPLLSSDILDLKITISVMVAIVIVIVLVVLLLLVIIWRKRGIGNVLRREKVSSSKQKKIKDEEQPLLAKDGIELSEVIESNGADTQKHTIQKTRQYPKVMKEHDGFIKGTGGIIVNIPYRNLLTLYREVPFDE